MEVRKVQLTGLKSYTITLPKPWIVQHNIQKKQPIFIKIMKNGSLLLHPKAIDDDMEIATDIEITEQQNPEFLFRSLLGAYASGSNKFKIINKGQFKPEYKKKILEFVNRLDGLEIKEENLNSIYIQEDVFFTINNFTKLYRSISGQTTQMINTLITMFKEHNWNDADKIIEQDNELNQVFWKVMHMTHLSLSLPMYVPQSLSKINSIYGICLSLENIGDQFVAFGRSIGKIDMSETEPMLLIEIEGFLQKIHNLLEMTFESLKLGDENQANINIKKSMDLQNECDTIFPKILNRGETTIALFKMIISLKNIGRIFQNMGELVFNVSITP